MQGQSPKPLCPVCGTRCEGPPRYQYSVERAAAHFCPPSRDADRNARLRAALRRLWQGDVCEVHICPACAFGFGFPFVAGDEEFYGILHEQRGYPQWKWDFAFAHERVFRPGSGGRVLDIGAGDGAFLKSLDSKWQRFAVERSALTRGDLQAAGITVFPSLEDAVQRHAGTFDAVTIFQVLEHVADFRSMLAQARALLAPSGRILVTVPDGDAMIRQEQCTGCPDMPPNHLCKWSPRSLSLAFQQAGFVPGGSYPEPGSWRNVAANMHMRVMTDAAEPWSLAAQVYRLPSRKLRIPFLAGLGVAALARMLPDAPQLWRGGAFAMIGTTLPT